MHSKTHGNPVNPCTQNANWVPFSAFCRSSDHTRERTIILSERNYDVFFPVPSPAFICVVFARSMCSFASLSPSLRPPLPVFLSLIRTLMHTQSSPPRSLLLRAVSFTSVCDPRTDSDSREGGGRGWINTSARRPRGTLRLKPLAVQRPQARRLRSRE